MAKSRRQFLNASIVLMGAAAGCEKKGPEKKEVKAGEPPPGSPVAFATAPAVGPEVSASTFEEAGKLVQFQMTPEERAQAAGSWRSAVAPLYERRVGPKKVALEPEVAPWSRVDPSAGQKTGPAQDRFVRSKADASPLPAKDEDIAYATVARLSRWIEQKKLTSERLTRIYLERLERFDPKLRCVITLTKDHALAQAKQADAEIAAGKYRGPLHGIPWGGKDLLDTAGIPTTYGAEPFRNRVPAEDAAVVKRLHQAGAVLIA
jgi:hypothetical protein